MRANRWNIPDLGLGIGLRTVHFPYILEHWPKIDFFEIVSENFMDTNGRPMWVLDQVAERYPVIMHGVSMSIGSTDPLDFDYLRQLKALAERIKAPMVSDHLCFTGVLGRNVHDLLPVPLDEPTLQHVAERVRTVQDFLERPLFLENPSSYVEFTCSTMTEWDFLSRLMELADCGMLLDLNNVYVSSFNHGFDPNRYVDAIDPTRVAYHHLAGHTNKGTHIIDTHNDYVIDPVWQLYERFHKRSGGRTTLVEWDESIPSFEVVHAEVLKARQYRQEVSHV
ncbi:MAG: MNIO family bufferin maturase [Candidatus Xenobia bacterium]